jgi:hypothetical protein
MYINLQHIRSSYENQSLLMGENIVTRPHLLCTVLIVFHIAAHIIVKMVELLFKSIDLTLGINPIRYNQVIRGHNNNSALI